MNLYTRSGFAAFKKVKRKRLFITICFTLLTLFLILSGAINLTSTYAGKAHAAANDQVYPAPITEFSVPTTNSWPDGITTGHDHNLWFTEYNTDKIGQVTPSGAVTDFAIPNTTGGSITPTGITAGPDGNLWFTSRNGGIVGRVTPQGQMTEFKYSYTTPMPGSITVGPDGNLWFVDYMGWVVRMTPQGKATEFPIPSSAINPGSITTGPDGNLWFTAISQIGRITPTGTIKMFSLNSAYSFPGGITPGPDGNLWFTESANSGGVIGRITPNGAITDFPVPTITYPDNTTWPVNPSYMTAGPDGNLWFTSDAQALGRITPAGNVTEFISQNASSFGGGISPTGLMAGPDGNIWFADYGLNKVGYLAVGGTSPTPTPTATTPTPPSSSCPSLTECLLAANSAYGLDNNTFIPPAGMTVLETSDQTKVADGFEAVALIDGSGNIIVANEGTVIEKSLRGISQFARNTLLADLAISQDHRPPALTDAINFAIAVQKKYGKSIYVTGHSLGGIEAEAEAQALQANLAGGVTFGATGLPGNTTAGVPSNVVNYVDYGDPVGNFAFDVNKKVFANMNHYGTVIMEGPPANAIVLHPAVNTTQAQSIDPFASNRSDATDMDVAANIASGICNDHPIANYAADLGIKLNPKATVAPAISLDEFMMAYGGQLGPIGIKDAEATTANNNGTLVSPDITMQYNGTANQITIDQTTNVTEPWGTLNSGGVATLSIDPNTEQVTGETFASSDSSVYNVTLNSSEVVTVVQVNTKAGTSYQIIYDTTGNQTWSSYTNFYTGTNGSGTLTEAIYNWRAGGSQVQLFTNLPPGDKEELKNYSGPNGTGKLISIKYL